VNVILRSALMGIATGGRMATGLAAVALSADPSAKAQPDRFLAKRWVKGVVGVAAAAELVTDKLPQTPSRQSPPVLIPRIVAAAGTGVVLARREAHHTGWHRPSQQSQAGSVVVSAAVAAVTCLASSWLGPQWRQWAATRFGSDYVGAGIEDASTIALAYVGSHPA
jgi:uncharacterized membrane protein